MSSRERRESRRRFQLRGIDRVIVVALAVLALATIAVTLCRSNGLYLIRSELYFFLPLFILMIAVGWGVLALVRLIRHRVVRIVVGLAAALLFFLGATVAMSYGSFIISLSMPLRSATVSTEDRAHSLVVMRELDSDEERLEIRRAARVAADPEADPEVAADDFGYIYTAYKPVWRYFYKADTLIEGEVNIGYASEANLMVEWEEEGTVGHFFVENPGPGDGGEMRASSL